MSEILAASMLQYRMNFMNIKEWELVVGCGVFVVGLKVLFFSSVGATQENIRDREIYHIKLLKCFAKLMSFLKKIKKSTKMIEI